MAKWRVTQLDAEAAEEAASLFEGRKHIKDEVHRQVIQPSACIRGISAFSILP